MSSQPIHPSSTAHVPLKDTVLALLSLAAEEGHRSIPLIDFYRAFADTYEEYGDVLPPLIFTRTAGSAYSKRLDEALAAKIGYSVDLPNPRLQRTSIELDAAKRHLAWLDSKYGPEYMDRVKHLTSTFIDKLQTLKE